MAENIPSLGEIENVRVDPSLSGIAPEPVIDNSRMVESLNQNARFHAQQVANKYNTFLQNKKDLFANIGSIQGLDSLPEDKPLLQKQAADILEQIGKDPSTITGGTGFNEVQSKMAQFKQDAMAAKQKYLSDKSDRILLQTTPEMDTPENRKLLDDYVKGGLGAKAPILNTPTIMDERAIFEKTLADSTHPYTENTVGKDGMHYINSGLEFNPNAFSKQWGLVGGQSDKNNKLLSGAIKYNYDHLPTKEKEKYDAEGGGGVEQYWKDRGQQYLDAHLPKGSYEATPLVYDENGNVKSGGNYRFDKTSKPDTQWIADQRLAQQAAHEQETERQGRERLSVEWDNYNLRSKQFNKLHGEDKSDTRMVIGSLVDDFANAKQVQVPSKDINGNPISKNVMRITDVPFLKSLGLVSKQGTVTGAIDYDPQTDQLTIEKLSPDDGSIMQSTPISKDEWLNSKIKNFTAEKKDISGISAAVKDFTDQNGGNLLQSVSAARQQQSEQQSSKDSKREANNSSYYNDEKNVVSQKGDKFTYKDGTTWQYKNGKFIKVK